MSPGGKEKCPYSEKYVRIKDCCRGYRKNCQNKASNDMVTNFRDMFESRVSAGAKEKLPTRASGKPDAETISSWFFDMEGHAKKCVEKSRNAMHGWSSIQRRKWISSENCPQLALKLFCNAKTWHVLDDPIFYGQWTNLHDRLQNGPKPVTNAWIDWFLMFITRVNTNNIVMWEILLSNADWDCFKTLILQEILRLQNLHQVEHCAFSEVIHLYQ